MSQKRKISFRKILQTLLTLVVVAGCVVAVTSADRRRQKEMVNSVRVHIRNEKSVGFLDEQTVMDLLLNNRHLDAKQIAVEQLDLHQMEEIATSNPWISDAQVYLDNRRDLHITLTQRTPSVRIFEANGNSYYIDTALKTVPLSTRYVHYAPVVTGVPTLRDDSAGRSIKGQIFYVSQRIEKDEFWKAQVAQISMNSAKEFELIPVLGKHRIILGDTVQLDEKLEDRKSVV